MKKIMATTAAVAALVLLAAGTASAAQFIVNGSFESPYESGSYGLPTSILGWTAVGSYPIEVGAATLYGIAGYDGLQVMELDSTGNADVEQIVATSAGTYQLSFLYAQRLGTSVSSCTFDLSWNGNVVHLSPTSTTMALYSATVTAVGGNNYLHFIGTGTQDSLGALIDKVELNSVPDGGLTAMLLGLGLLGLGSVRRMIK